MKKAIMTFLLLSGLSVGMIANAETADDILAAVNDNTAEATSVSADLSMDFSISEYTDSGEDKFEAGAGFTIEYAAKQPGMYMLGEILTEYNGESDDYSYELYCVPESSAADYMMLYENMGSHGWTARDFKKSNVFDADSLALCFDMDDSLNYELAPNFTYIDGTECYELTCEIDGSELDGIAESANDLAEGDNDELLKMADWILGGMKFNVSYFVTVDQYLPVSVHIDMDGSELSNLNGLLNLLALFSGTDRMEVNINDVSLDCSIGYDDTEEISVPDDVLASFETENSTSAANDMETKINNLVAKMIK